MDETQTVMVSTLQGQEPVPVTIPRRVGNVKVGEMLGEGTGGVVMAGYDEVLNRRVAVKFLHALGNSPNPAAVNEIVEGVRSAARVIHPNIVTVYSAETVRGMPVIVMELIDGVSLREVMNRGGAMDAALAVYAMRQVALAVEALHEGNVVHRDLKPANILVDRHGGPHVCDFGLACEFNLAASRGEARSIGGSPLYMAPEMFDGHVSPQSDVYALGVLLFECLAGQPPFRGNSMTEMSALHLSGVVPMELLEQQRVPDDLSEVVRRAMNRQRILRYKSATHFVRALEAVQLPLRRDDLLRGRLAELVMAGRAEGRSAAQSLSVDAPAMTTFDLIAKRANQKRSARPGQ
jgi:serine/threonine-protein kinase